MGNVVSNRNYTSHDRSLRGFSIRLDANVYQRVQLLAQETGVSMGSVINRSLLSGKSIWETVESWRGQSPQASQYEDVIDRLGGASK